MFTDNMVLQRERPNPIWGWTSPGHTVMVRAGGKWAGATADDDGKWLAELPPLPVGGPYTLTVSGQTTVLLNNVLVGDVWVCSGQSNMEYGVGNEDDGEAEIAAADHPQIRIYTVQRNIALAPRETAGGEWLVCTPENLKNSGEWGGFSAIGYFFGRELNRDLNVPIGLIHTSWGGTPAESWASEEALRAKMPEFDQQLDAVREERDSDGLTPKRTLSERIDEWFAINDPGIRTKPSWADVEVDDAQWRSMPLPCYFQRGGDPDLEGVNGIIWFRKEFDIPINMLGKDLVLNLLVDDNDRTWVNGVEVGATEGCAVPRAYHLSASLLRPTGNVIAVRVLDTGGRGGIYGELEQLCIASPDGSTIALAGSWRYKLAVDLRCATDYPVDIPNDPCQPSVLYNGMIHPLIPFSIKGVIWYQGESNEDRAFQYRTLLPTMIVDWRERWGVGEFPFLIVQLAGYTEPPEEPGMDSWAELREAQWITARDMRNCGIATAIDVGDAKDIHPKNKKEVARRLALVARGLVYGSNIEFHGPVFESISITGSSASMRFSAGGEALITTDGGIPKGFAIAGEDRTWRWADARIEGKTIVVSSPDVPNPIAVRYGWASGRIGNVASQTGLPMFPFRTDDFPMSTDRRNRPS